MNLLFRNLEKNEIKPAIAKVTEKGVTVLLWKQNFVDLDILDEVLESTDYEITYPQNHICRISIWDKTKKIWVSKEGIGEGFSAKSIANDALKRAGMSWGIGRELFSSGELFISKEDLVSWKQSNDKFYCYDEFKVLDIEYEQKKIKHLTLGIFLSGTFHKEVSFSFAVETVKKESKTTKKKADSTSKKSYTIENNPNVSNEKPKTNKQEPIKNQEGSLDTKQETTDTIIDDNEIILLGNCRGKKYGDVKESPLFKSFLNWAKNASTRYPDVTIEEQFLKFKALANKISA